MCTLCDLSTNFSFYFSLANWRYFYNITCVWETFDKSCLLSFQFHYLHMTVVLEVLSLHNSSTISFELWKLESFLHFFFCFFVEAIDKSSFSFIPIWIFAHENSIEKSFCGCTLHNYFITVLQIGELLHSTKCFWEAFGNSIQQKKQTKAYWALKVLIMHNISIDSIGWWFQLVSCDRKNKKKMTTWSSFTIR
jgi:hypothetical protein